MPPQSVRAELKENIGAAVNRRAGDTHPRRFGKEANSACGETSAGEDPCAEEARPCADLQLCEPYSEAILAYLLAAEQRHGAVREYMPDQPHITAHMRSVLVDWLVDVSHRFKLQPQATFLAVGLLDRYLAVHSPPRGRLQLVGVCCLMIIGKYEEIYPPALADYVAACDDTYTAAELLAAESDVLTATGFELNRPTPLAFLELLQARFSLPTRPLQYCHYVLESALLDLGHLRRPGSALAAGAWFLISKLFEGCRWGEAQERVSGVSAAQARACARDLYVFMQRNEQLALTAVKRKFATARFGGVSRYRIERVAQD